MLKVIVYHLLGSVSNSSRFAQCFERRSISHVIKNLQHAMLNECKRIFEHLLGQEGNSNEERITIRHKSYMLDYDYSSVSKKDL